jgi:hypothetical protein
VQTPERRFLGWYSGVVVFSKQKSCLGAFARYRIASWYTYRNFSPVLEHFFEKQGQLIVVRSVSCGFAARGVKILKAASGKAVFRPGTIPKQGKYLRAGAQDFIKGFSPADDIFQ